MALQVLAEHKILIRDAESAIRYRCVPDCGRCVRGAESAIRACCVRDAVRCAPADVKKNSKCRTNCFDCDGPNVRSNPTRLEPELLEEFSSEDEALRVERDGVLSPDELLDEDESSPDEFSARLGALSVELVLGGVVGAVVVRVRRRRRRVRVGLASSLERIPVASSNSRSPKGLGVGVTLLSSLRSREADSEDDEASARGLISRARSRSTAVGGGGGPPPADSAGSTSTSTRGGPSLMLLWRVTLALTAAVVGLSLSCIDEPNKWLLRT